MGLSEVFGPFPPVLLVELFLDRFLAGLRAECAPQTEWAFTPGCAITGTTSDHRPIGRIPRLDRVGQEDHCAVGHQDMATALVLTAWWQDPKSGRSETNA